MADVPFNNDRDASAPFRHAWAITPSDTNALADIPKAVKVGGAGNITMRAVDSAADVVWVASSGEIIPGRIAFIRATGTTATGLLGLL